MFSNAINFLSVKRSIKASAALFSLSAALITAQPAMATTVQFQTVMGDFTVNLYDKTTPETVKNFLAYVNAPSMPYKNSVIHRSLPGFVIQGGGFKYDTKSPLIAIPQNTAVINEPVYANKRGTIAMAKLPGKVNSATNQWFFNLADNSSSLDSQNGGFTVFGEVTGNGMGIIDSMAALSIFSITGNDSWSQIPLRAYTTTDGTNGVPVTDKNYVMILGIVILDASPGTADTLTPAKTTYTPSTGSSGGGGGGSMGWLSLFMLLSLTVIGRSRR
jgi:cyclophilin family peptidyl-prolyl cis-trans isomerase